MTLKDHITDHIIEEHGFFRPPETVMNHGADKNLAFFDYILFLGADENEKCFWMGIKDREGYLYSSPVNGPNGWIKMGAEFLKILELFDE